MARIDEIAPDLYRVSIYSPQFDLQFNHFLIKDNEPQHPSQFAGLDISPGSAIPLATIPAPGVPD
jgi:hypothetical protein